MRPGLIRDYKGHSLNLLPSQLTTWRRWKGSQPHTLAMANPTEFLGFSRPQGIREHFIIRVLLGENSKAYYYADVEAVGAVNGMLGEFPVLVWANEELYHVYLRTVGERTLRLYLVGDELVDEETGSCWDPKVGLAINGRLSGEALRPIPGLSSLN